VSLHRAQGRTRPAHRSPRNDLEPRHPPRREPPDFLTCSPLGHTWGEPHRPRAAEAPPTARRGHS
jgi:hypothetical protein